jgi:hypothetical protein
MSQLPPPADDSELPLSDVVFELLADWVALQASIVAHDRREPRAWQWRQRKTWLADGALLEGERRTLLHRLSGLGSAVLAPYGVVVR